MNVRDFLFMYTMLHDASEVESLAEAAQPAAARKLWRGTAFAAVLTLALYLAFSSVAHMPSVQAASHHLARLLTGSAHHADNNNPLQTQWVTVLAIACSSSTDNFAVGLSVALAGSRLPPRVNLIISVCNALGALMSTGVGALLGRAAPTLGPAAAAAVFLYLAFEEITSFRQGERASPLARSASEGLVWKLALPMTLNNLAGGVASGILGVSPLVSGFGALVASYLMMAAGYHLGRRLGATVERCLDPRVLAATIFVAVALTQIVDALQAMLHWSSLPRWH